MRWQLAALLAGSDIRVNELVDMVGEPQNLVSYHLAVLKRGGLLSERRSSADARDVYYHLKIEQLGADLSFAAAQLHPALGPAAGRLPQRRRPRVLFICTGNSARSQIAEAVLRRVADGRVDVSSAGPRPAGIHPRTIKVLAELGLPTRGLRSKGLEEFDGVRFDWVISLCDIAREECAPRPEHPRYVHWSLADPAEVRGSAARQMEAFRQSARELEDRIRLLIPALVPIGGDPHE